MLSVNTSSLSNNSSSTGQPSLASQVVDEQGKKREIRLMKNRYCTCTYVFSVIYVLFTFSEVRFSVYCVDTCTCVNIVSHCIFLLRI